MMWEDVVKRDDIKGGELRMHLGSRVFHGLISKISIVKSWVCLEVSKLSEWRAESRKWELVQNASKFFFIDAKVAIPRYIPDGRLYFETKSIGFGYISPKGCVRSTADLGDSPPIELMPQAP